jgi:hypothetical protein
MRYVIEVREKPEQIALGEERYQDRFKAMLLMLLKLLPAASLQLTAAPLAVVWPRPCARESEAGATSPRRVY